MLSFSHRVRALSDLGGPVLSLETKPAFLWILHFRMTDVAVKDNEKNHTRQDFTQGSSTPPMGPELVQGPCSLSTYTSSLTSAIYEFSGSWGDLLL